MTGLSDQDQYRVVELEPGQSPPAKEMEPWLGFRETVNFGSFVVYEYRWLRVWEPGEGVSHGEPPGHAE